MSHFKYCSSSSNYVYFKCVYRRNNCPGTIRQNIITKEINITTHCDNKINHKSITLNEFRKFYDKKQYNSIPMESKRLQKYYVKLYIEANKEEINITDLKKNLKMKMEKNWYQIIILQVELNVVSTLLLCLFQGPLHLNINL